MEDQNQNNAPTIDPLDKIQDGMQRMKVEREDNNEVEQKDDELKYPDRPGEPDCVYFTRSGKCGYGTNCRFNHPSKRDENTGEFPQREGQPNCGHFMKTGTCKYGSSCKYHHPPDRCDAEHILLNTLDLPIRQGEKHCPYYMRTYKCKFGRACKFDHPEPSTLESTPPLSGSSAMGTAGPALTSNGVTYVGAIPNLSLPNSSCVASVPSPQTYMPFFPYTHSPFIAQGWNNYMGNLNSIPAPHMMMQNFVYNSNSQGQPVTGGLGGWSTQAVSFLPQRTDQPECRHFMNTGSCKYGLSCKYHHPKERIANNVGPHGLPFRPGQDICYDFSLRGVCQYGPTCKYDHPMNPASYSYVPGARNTFILSSSSNSTEVSQSKSSNITNWIPKPETATEKDREISVKKSAEAPCKEVHDDHPDVAVAADTAAPTSSEL